MQFIVKRGCLKQEKRRIRNEWFPFMSLLPKNIFHNSDDFSCIEGYGWKVHENTLVGTFSKIKFKLIWSVFFEELLTGNLQNSFFFSFSKNKIQKKNICITICKNEYQNYFTKRFHRHFVNKMMMIIITIIMNYDDNNNHGHMINQLVKERRRVGSSWFFFEQYGLQSTPLGFFHNQLRKFWKGPAQWKLHKSTIN